MAARSAHFGVLQALDGPPGSGGDLAVPRRLFSVAALVSVSVVCLAALVLRGVCPWCPRSSSALAALIVFPSPVFSSPSSPQCFEHVSEVAEVDDV